MGVPAAAPVKSEPDANATGIRRQVEYYFSDSNLPRDRFLRSKMDENDAGWVDIDMLLTFNKLKELQATRESFCEAIAGSAFLEVSEDATRVRRTTPVPDADEWRLRAIYAKGWIATDPEPPVADVEALFAPYGKVVSVRMRRWSGEDGTRHFKGSVFVEFDTAEAADRVVADSYTIKVRDVDEEDGDLVEKELIVMSVDSYFEKKRVESRERSKKFKEKKATLRAAERTGGGDGKSGKAGQNGSAPAVKREFVKGLILRFTGVGETTSREDLKEVIEAHGSIAWIDFERGAVEGHVRFTTEGAAAKAAAELPQTAVAICGKVPEYSVLDGDEEGSYWTKVWAEQDKAKNSKKRGRFGDNHGRSGGHKRFRGGGRGGGRGRGHRGP
jgi:lupus La protein